MQGIHVDVPDVDVLLELQPEELAAAIFRVLVTVEGGRYRRGEQFHPWNTGAALREHAQRVLPGQFYPLDRIEEVILALLEGFQWMVNSGLLLPALDPGSANTGWMTLTRRARALRTDEDFRQFAFGQSIDRSLLHPSIATDAWRNFSRGNYPAAVFEAMRTVEIAVREAAGYAPSEHGVPMVRRAFNKDSGPLTDPSQPEAEREALGSLFAGAIGSYKNPHSHRMVPLDDAKEAFEMVMLASHLLGIVDTRRSQE